jgi:hypothetical protein
MTSQEETFEALTQPPFLGLASFTEAHPPLSKVAFAMADLGRWDDPITGGTLMAWVPYLMAPTMSLERYLVNPLGSKQRRSAPHFWNSAPSI